MSVEKNVINFPSLLNGQAIKIAEQFDRVHLKSTYFKYGEYLRDNGDIKGAIKYFEMSDAGATNVTKMLMDDPQALKVRWCPFQSNF